MLKFGSVNYVFGSPGSGKTTLCSKIIQYYNKKKIKTYSNFPCKGAILIDDESIGYYNFNDSVIVLDEAGISYSNRDACNKRGLMQDKQRLQYWKLVRHYRAQIIVVSQSWNDVDKKVRDLANYYFYIRRSIIPGFTVVRPIFKVVDIDETSHEPADMYKFDVFWHNMWIWRRKWYKFFDSYDCPSLPDYPVNEPIN